MILRIHDTLLFSGTVSKISHSSEWNSATVEFAEHGKFEYEFLDKKARHVKMSKFKIGQKLIAIGDLKEGTHLAATGKDIISSGIIEMKPFAIIAGRVSKIKEFGENRILTITDNNEVKYLVRCEKDISTEISLNMNVIVTCGTTMKRDCLYWCSKRDCDNCKLVEKKKYYNVLNVNVV